jgi:hypothetical protein
VVAKDFVIVKTVTNMTSVKCFIIQFSLSLQVTLQYNYLFSLRLITGKYLTKPRRDC